MFCWIDGKFLKDSNLKITPFDFGFMYGYHAFEIFRTYKGKVVFFQEHFYRLVESLMNFQIKMPYTIQQLEQVIEELTKMDETDAIVHLYVTAGQNFFNRKSHYKPKVLILRSLLSKKRIEEISLEYHRLTWELNSSISRFHGQKLFIPHEIDGKYIYYNEKDIIIGGTYSTIFWAKNGILYTPRIQEDSYCDIMRKWVIITAKQLGIKVIEEVFIRKDLENAYECFVTNAIDGVVPVSQIQESKFLGKEGPIYEQIHHAYLEEIFQMIQGD